MAHVSQGRICETPQGAVVIAEKQWYYASSDHIR